MDANRLLEMIRLLTESTRSGAIKWAPKRSPAGEGYACEVAGMQVLVAQHGPISAMGGARIVVSTPTGVEIISAGEGEFLQTSGPAGISFPVRIGGEVAKLFETVRAAANHSNAAIDKIIIELNRKTR